MNRPSRILGAITVACLLATHVSGLHLHVDETGRSAGLHSAHAHLEHDYQTSTSHPGDLHPHRADDHDHSKESDVALFEQLNSSPYSDQVTAALDQIFAPQAYASTQVYAGIPTDPEVYDASCMHWRPPLRAPPVLH